MKYETREKYDETAFTSSNPVTDNQTALGPPPESPLYSPGVNAFEWEEEREMQQRQRGGGGGGEVFDFSTHPQNYDAHQPQGRLLNQLVF